MMIFLNQLFFPLNSNKVPVNNFMHHTFSSKFVSIFFELVTPTSAQSTIFLCILQFHTKVCQPHITNFSICNNFFRKITHCLGYHKQNMFILQSVFCTGYELTKVTVLLYERNKNNSIGCVWNRLVVPRLGKEENTHVMNKDLLSVRLSKLVIKCHNNHLSELHLLVMEKNCDQRDCSNLGP